MKAIDFIIVDISARMASAEYNTERKQSHNFCR